MSKLFDVPGHLTDAWNNFSDYLHKFGARLVTYKEMPRKLPHKAIMRRVLNIKDSKPVDWFIFTAATVTVYTRLLFKGKFNKHAYAEILVHMACDGWLDVGDVLRFETDGYISADNIAKVDYYVKHKLHMRDITTLSKYDQGKGIHLGIYPRESDKGPSVSTKKSIANLWKRI